MNVKDESVDRRRDKYQADESCNEVLHYNPLWHHTDDTDFSNHFLTLFSDQFMFFLHCVTLVDLKIMSVICAIQKN